MRFEMKYQIMCLLILLSFNSIGQKRAKGEEVKVNQERIENRIFKLAEFGKDADGKGYRVAFTQGDIDGRAWFIGQMKEAGLDVIIDNAGNIVGRRKGKDSSLKPIAFGSHIDMVPDGGNYDGCVGSMSALEVIEVLNEHKITTNHPLEVIIFSNEEGGVIGSMAMAGHLDSEGLKVVSQSGLTMAEGIKAIGGNPENLHSMVRKKGDLAAFFELHIEQGGILDRENIQIGVVEGIVGIIDWEVTIEGFANHAGTTPMNLRRDAMLAAAKLIVAVNDIITGETGRQVGTVGKIAAHPGAYNVVPGEVVLGLEIRDLSYEKILRLFKMIENKAAVIADSTGTQISFVQKNAIKPALTAKPAQEIIAQLAKSLGLSYKYMPSGAGHDSQEMALICPIGMIFVPSRDGISHSPKEFTKASDMANGANVLLQTILAMDKK
jgi:beta-ureidopropionase / N-carbamoyl-L-amino-acid hydrolase